MGDEIFNKHLNQGFLKGNDGRKGERVFVVCIKYICLYVTNGIMAMTYIVGYLYCTVSQQQIQPMMKITKNFIVDMLMCYVQEYMYSHVFA